MLQKNVVKIDHVYCTAHRIGKQQMATVIANEMGNNIRVTADAN